MRILLVEDDEILLERLSQSLTRQHYTVDTAKDGTTGWNYTQSAAYDLILLDVGLPEMDGITLCRKLRSQKCITPILLITAKDKKSDRIQGLDAGADDYLVKPLDFQELQARVRALLRRRTAPLTPTLQIGGLQLDPSRCEVTYDGELLTLTPKEYSLLELFLRHPTRVFSRGQIIEHLWTFDDPPLEESVKAHIKGLRQKLKAVGISDWIENVYGIGYRLKEELSQQTADEATHKPKDEKLPAVLPVAPQPTNSGSDARSPVAKGEPSYQQTIDQLWQQYQYLMLQRLEQLQQVAAAISDQALSLELRQSGQQAAHKLAGVLGTFDREAGTSVAREIEEILEQPDELTPNQCQQVLNHVQFLEKLLFAPGSLPSALLPAQSVISNATDLGSTGPTPTVRILAVDDDPLVLAELHTLLSPWGMQITTVDNPLQFWLKLGAIAPDLVILDVEMPHQSGIELCQAIRAHPRWQSLPVMFLTAHHQAETIQAVFTAGADDYITKPFVGAELLTRITNRLERTRLLRTLSTQDPLTGLMNQPCSLADLERMLQQAKQENHPFCLILLDLQGLKQINLQHGHWIGNQVLQLWGHLLQVTFHGQASLGYWCNGEFAIGIPHLTQAEVKQRFSHFFASLHQQIYTTPTGNCLHPLCQVAVVEFPCHGLTLQALYQSAHDSFMTTSESISRKQSHESVN